MEKTIAAIFNSRLDAEKALRFVRADGFDISKASIIEKGSSTYDYNHNNDFDTDDGSMHTALYDGGAAIISGIGSGEVQGLGLTSARGPVADEVNGNVKFIDIISKMGIPKESSRQYFNELKNDRTLWTIKADPTKALQISNALRTNGAVMVNIH